MAGLGGPPAAFHVGNTPWQVHTYHPSDKAIAKAGKHVLGLAMETDPLILVVARKRQKSRRRLTESLVGVHYKVLGRDGGFAWTGKGDSPQAFVVFYEMPRLKVKDWHLQLYGFWSLLLHMAPGRLFKATEEMEGWGKKKMQFVEGCPGSVLYIFLLGTLPTCQGQGMGSALMGHVTALADAQGMACYLESTTEDSRRLYARHGFEVLEEMPFMGEVPIWRMARPARAAASVVA